MLVAHITDTHITSPGTCFYGIADTAGALTRAIAAINRLDPSPDLVVLTGTKAKRLDGSVAIACAPTAVSCLSMGAAPIVPSAAIGYTAT